MPITITTPNMTDIITYCYDAIASVLLENGSKLTETQIATFFKGNSQNEPTERLVLILNEISDKQKNPTAVTFCLASGLNKFFTKDNLLSNKFNDHLSNRQINLTSIKNSFQKQQREQIEREQLEQERATLNEKSKKDEFLKSTAQAQNRIRSRTSAVGNMQEGRLMLDINYLAARPLEETTSTKPEPQRDETTSGGSVYFPFSLNILAFIHTRRKGKGKTPSAQAALPGPALGFKPYSK